MMQGATNSFIIFTLRSGNVIAHEGVLHQPDFLTGTRFPEIIGYCTYNTHPLTSCPLKTHTPPNVTSSLVAFCFMSHSPDFVYFPPFLPPELVIPWLCFPNSLLLASLQPRPFRIFIYSVNSKTQTPCVVDDGGREGNICSISGFDQKANIGENLSVLVYICHGQMPQKG